MTTTHNTTANRSDINYREVRISDKKGDKADREVDIADRECDIADKDGDIGGR